MSDGDHGAGSSGIGRLSLTDLLSSESNLSRHGTDSERGVFRDALDGLCYLAVGGVVGLLFLDVEVLSVLTDDDKVNWSDRGVGAGRGLDWAYVRIEV